MYARSLQDILRRYSSTADFGREANDAFDRRFRALRGAGLLPRGRERRADRLSNEQIAHAILSIASIQPTWAGLTTITLSKLVPAGGPSASFLGAATLVDAISQLLESEIARSKLIRLTVSSAEGGVNSNGYAQVVYVDDDQTQQCHFVHRMATSLLSPGSEKRVDPDRRYARISRELVLTRDLFEDLAREIERSQHWAEPPGEGKEYAQEEAEEKRRRALGVKPGSRYLNIGVDNHVAWPREERLIQFDNYELVLMPRTREHSASVHIDLNRHRISRATAKTIINRLLSVMSWVDDQYAISQGGWSGNPVPVAVHKRELASVTAHPWIFERKIPDTEEARRALALYREARNAQQNFMVSYAVLNFYKVIELRHQGRGPAKLWIRDNFDVVRSIYSFDRAFERLDQASAGQAKHEYLYTACRVAVAHGSAKSPSDPDDANEISRLHTAADVLRWMARHLIKTEMGIGDRPWEINKPVNGAR